LDNAIVARGAGNLRKHFTRTVQTTPHAYRRTFATRDEPAA